MAEVGTGLFTYEVEAGWGTLPENIELGEVAAVACDSQDRVYLYSRSDLPMVVLDREGTFLSAWGLAFLEDAHGLYIDSEQTLWCTERETHCIRRCSLDGDLLLTIGTPRRPGQAGAPFNLPTDMAVDSQGCRYIADGYGNARVHKYSPEGQRLHSWGEPGQGSGQFDLPHCVRVDAEDRVLVADCGNNRIQIFDTDGAYLLQWEDLRKPASIHIDTEGIVYVAEREQRISILDEAGHLLSRWEFLGCPHGICTDSRGDLYVSEVQTDGRYQKFIRQALNRQALNRLPGAQS